MIGSQAEDPSTPARVGSTARGIEGAVDADGRRYARFAGHTGRPRMLSQKVECAPRVHLDIGTGDIVADAARLVGPVARVNSWIVRRARTGHRVCPVPAPGVDWPGRTREVRG